MASSFYEGESCVSSRSVAEHYKSHAVPQANADQCQYLGNCIPTHSLTQQQSTNNKLGLMLC